ncbi:MAG: hypothetical protein HOM21_01935 [Halobacteriovoraceae bacterium]|nr:hypothetical protein [Halobacteriovoraceae bacterium]
MWLKIKGFILFGPLLLGILPAHAAGEWSLLASYKKWKQNLTLEYSLQRRQIRFSYRSSRRYNKGQQTEVYDVSTASEVETASYKVVKLMAEEKVSLTTRDLFVAKLEELRFLNGRAHPIKVLHFNLVSVSKDKHKNPILEQQDQLNAIIKMGPESYRSIPLINIELSRPIGKFQLRAVIDAKNNISKFSLINREGVMEGFQYSRFGSNFLFKNESGENLFLMRIDPLENASSGRVSLITLEQSGIENVTKRHYKLTRSADYWSLLEYSSNTTGTSDTVVGVPLTTITAHHEPVKRIGTTDNYISTLEDSEILEFVAARLSSSINKLDHFSSSARKTFEKCLVERQLIKENENPSLDKKQIKKSCLIHASMEVGHRWSLHHANEQFAALANKGNFDAYKGQISSQFVACLVENKFYKNHQFYREVDYQKIDSTSQSSFDLIFKSCLGAVKEKIGEVSLTLKLGEDEQINELVEYEKISNAVIKDVIERGYRPCIKMLGPEHSELCHKAGEFIKVSDIFMSSISNKILEGVHNNQSLFKELRKTGLDGYEKCQIEIESDFFSSLDASNFDNKLAAGNKKLLTCVVAVIKNMEKVMPLTELAKRIEGLNFFKQRHLSVAKEQLDSAREEQLECLESRLEEESEVLALIGHLDELRFECTLEGLKSVIPEVYGQAVTPLIQQFFNSEKDSQQITTLIKRLSRQAKREIRRLVSLEEINTTLEEMELFSMSTILERKIELLVETQFPLDSPESEYNQKSGEAIYKKLFEHLKQNPDESLHTNLKAFLSVQLKKYGTRGIEVHANDLLRTVARFSAFYAITRDVDDDSLRESDSKSIINEVEQVYQNCLSRYKPNSDTSLDQYMQYCQKKMVAERIFLVGKKKYEGKVAKNYPLSSRSATRILNPIQYMKSCIEDTDPLNKMSMEQYSAYATACVTLTSVDIAGNLIRNKIHDFRSIIRNRPSMSPLAQANYCMVVNVFTEIARNSEDTPELKGLFSDGDDPHEFGKKQRSIDKIFYAANKPSRGNIDKIGGASMLSFLRLNDNPEASFRNSDRRKLKAVLKAIATEEKLRDDWTERQSQKCYETADQFIMIGFKEYVIQQIPTAYSKIKLESGETTEEVLRALIDVELLELVTKVKLEKGKSRAYVRDDDGNLMNSPITTKMAMDALSGFMNVLGGYISKGFIFDREQMRDEMIIFRNQAKDALRWFLTAPSGVTLNDLTERFGSSPLTDLMAYAAVSQNVHTRFHQFIRKMKTTDREKLWSEARTRSYSRLSKSQKKKYNWLNEKARNLGKLADNMTKSFDFTRIMRPDTKQGRDILSWIKTYYLLPKILSKPVSNSAEWLMNQKIADMILADDSEGGFAEEFVEEVAQYELRLEEEDRFYLLWKFWDDDGDYDFQHLQNVQTHWDAESKTWTNSALKAVKYYGEFILLPKILNRSQTSYQIKLHRKKFIALLQEAQSEN